LFPSPRLSLTVGVAVLALVACQKVPYTGRPQFNLVPDSIMRGVGKSSYQSVLAEERVQKAGDEVDVLNRVGRRIAKVANEPDYDWTYTMVDKDEVNAWCMPGGYITFYTGILPILQHEAGMAFVMGHEVGHAIAHHGAERMSQQLALIGGLAGLEIYMANATELKPKDRAIVLAALGVGTEVGVLLPFSRTHESEADVIGMMYMARAGYPPGESTDLWDRMEAASPASLPAFLSTHPSNEARKQNLREWMPRAKKKFEREPLAVDAVTKTLWTGAASPKGQQAGGGDDGVMTGPKPE
jgi:predicted Zn-dependent protease